MIQIVTATKGTDLVERIRRSDAEFNEMMRGADRFGADVHLFRLVMKGIECSYNCGYASGFQACQQGVRDAIGVMPDGE